MGLHHLCTSECLMYDSQACVACIHKFFTLQAHAALSHLAYNLWACSALYLNEPHICYSLMYDLWACIACSIHQFFTLWAHASQSSCVQLTGLQCPLCWASHPSHIQLMGLHCPYTHFCYLFCGLVLPSVVLCTTYRPTLPLYHEHIWWAHDALINFWNPLNITAEVYSGHCLQGDLFHPWLQSCSLWCKPTCFLDSGTNNLWLP